MPAVKVIPATKAATEDRFVPITRRRVAAYARVSTDLEEQETSYDAQVSYYTNLIKNHTGWEFAGIYSDEGITGTSVRKRPGFSRMIEEGLAGKFDLLVTKSISRFARNTVDSLTTIRTLKDSGVEVYFEKENIWTMDKGGELLITVLSSLAQEESRSISENVRWGWKRAMEQGKYSVPYSRFLGYDRGPDGKFVINEEEAKIVRLIYKLFLDGMTCTMIRHELERRGLKTVTGLSNWREGGIINILRNEKYKGDALIQKYYSKDFINKAPIRNHGEVQQYYVEGGHPAIIKPEVWNEAQERLNNKDGYAFKNRSYDPFACKIICGDCEGIFGRKIQNNCGRHYVRWGCNNKYLKDHRCSTPVIQEKKLQAAFMSALSQLIANKRRWVFFTKAEIEKLVSTEVLEGKLEEAEKKATDLYNQIEALVERNAREALDQTAYAEKYNGLIVQHEKAVNLAEDLKARISELKEQKKELKKFLTDLGEIREIGEQFNGETFRKLVDKMIVYSKENIVVRFKSGIEIKAEI